jgi:hypothetical protein
VVGARRHNSDWLLLLVGGVPQRLVLVLNSLPGRSALYSQRGPPFQGHSETFSAQSPPIRVPTLQVILSAESRKGRTPHWLALPDRSVLTPWSGGDGDVGAIPTAPHGAGIFFALGVGHSTVMRVPAVVPVTSFNGVPVPKTLVGPKSLKSKVPL